MDGAVVDRYGATTTRTTRPVVKNSNITQSLGHVSRGGMERDMRERRGTATTTAALWMSLARAATCLVVVVVYNSTCYIDPIAFYNTVFLKEAHVTVALLLSPAS